MRRLILAALSLALLAAPCAFAQQLVSVYVTSDNNGFSAPGANDSSLDLQKSLASKKTLRVVSSAQEADIVVRIDFRDSHKEVDGYTSNRTTSDDGRSSTRTTTQNDKTVRNLHATLMAGSYTQALEAQSEMSWRFAADNIAGQIERWTRENYSKLMSQRADKTNAASGLNSTQPPPSDASAPPATQTGESDIQPGMTADQVIKALGEPQKKVNFGTKSLWTYKGMQVVFESGKVTDVKF
ncbi:MAG: hypothetical protein JSS95_16515 [Acidobacteria bacterium]|nr:hypothetical protein [Acidobacteriota bacterium]